MLSTLEVVMVDDDFLSKIIPFWDNNSFIFSFTSFCMYWFKIKSGVRTVVLRKVKPTMQFRFVILSKTIFSIVIKFPYNARSDWLKQRALSENRARVDDGKLASKFLLRNFDKFYPN